MTAAAPAASPAPPQVLLAHHLRQRKLRCAIMNKSLARQLEGIPKAKAEGKYRGGIPTASAKAAQVFALVDVGKTRAEAAEELEISIRSVFRILRTRKDAENAPVAPPHIEGAAIASLKFWKNQNRKGIYRAAVKPIG
jgi:hypothetical protein